MSNYRPISNLSFFSKVAEKVIAQQLTEYLNCNCLIPVCQSAYRKNHSTETALTSLLNDLLVTLDSGQQAILVTLDQSAAFDVCDIDILLVRLELGFGIVGSALGVLPPTSQAEV